MNRPVSTGSNEPPDADPPAPGRSTPSEDDTERPHDDPPRGDGVEDTPTSDGYVPL